MDKDTKKLMEQLGLVPSTTDVIADVISNLIVTGLLGWALVFFFSLTWGQALVISWMYVKLNDTIRYSGK